MRHDISQFRIKSKQQSNYDSQLYTHFHHAPCCSGWLHTVSFLWNVYRFHLSSPPFLPRLCPSFSSDRPSLVCLSSIMIPRFKSRDELEFAKWNWVCVSFLTAPHTKVYRELNSSDWQGKPKEGRFVQLHTWVGVGRWHGLLWQLIVTNAQKKRQKAYSSSQNVTVDPVYLLKFSFNLTVFSKKVYVKTTRYTSTQNGMRQHGELKIKLRTVVVFFCGVHTGGMHGSHSKMLLSNWKWHTVSILATGLQTAVIGYKQSDQCNEVLQR